MMYIRIVDIVVVLSLLQDPGVRCRLLESPLQVETFRQECKHVCDDLIPDDDEPVCMMFSRYKRGYQYFVNLCHARRAICTQNILLHLVHPSRCRKSNQFYMPIN